MKHLLSKKINKSRDDVKGYGCIFGCDSTCSGGCHNTCSGGCTSCKGGCEATCSGGCKNGCKAWYM
jgi:ribosomally synthesized peptide (Cys-rich family)